MHRLTQMSNNLHSLVCPDMPAVVAVLLAKARTKHTQAHPNIHL